MFENFDGLKNTVDPERMTPKDLREAVNVDLDDAGQLHRRRGYVRKVVGQFHSLWKAETGHVLCVMDGVLSLVMGGYKIGSLNYPVGLAPLGFANVGHMTYFSSRQASGKVDLDTLTVSRWGYQRQNSSTLLTTPQHGGQDWWFSPVVNPESTLAPVAGKLMGAPPMATALCWYNGRIFLAEGKTLWATEPFTYDYIDKTKNYRQFETEITALAAVEDGVYVGTKDTLWFLAGSFGAETRTPRERAGVVPGSMLNVPWEVFDPQARLRPDLPQRGAKGMACLTDKGFIFGGPSGVTYNITRTDYILPKAVRAAMMYREQDGMKTLITSANSGGTPTASAAVHVGDSLTCEIIRAKPEP